MPRRLRYVADGSRQDLGRKQFRPPTAHPSPPFSRCARSHCNRGNAAIHYRAFITPEVRVTDSGIIDQTESGDYIAITDLPSRPYFPGSFLGLD